MKGRSTSNVVLICGVGLLTVACAGAATAARPLAFPGAPRPVVDRPGSLAPVAPDAPLGDGASAPPKVEERHAVVAAALGLVGVDYRFGGEDPVTGLDCSGLVRYVFGRYQVAVPRTVEEQFGAGVAVSRSAWSDVEAGDLIFFTTTGPGATHVGIVLGADHPGEFVHAPGTGGAVRVDRFDAGYWTPRIVGIRRLLRPHPTEDAFLSLP